MKNFVRQNLSYLATILLVSLIIIIVGGNQMPKYASRLVIVALFFALDMLYWKALKQMIDKRFIMLIAFIYWMPLIVLLAYFFANAIIVQTEWTGFFRLYFPALLLILIIGKLIYLLSILIGNFINLLLYFIFKKRKKKSEFKLAGTKGLLRFSALFSALVALLLICGMIFWTHDYKVKTLEIPIKNLPPAFENYKILQLSDFHVGTYINDKPIKKITKLVNAQHADIIVFTGDMVNLVSREAVRYQSNIKQMQAPDGVYAILGNHDYGEYVQWDSETEKAKDVQKLKDFYQNIGWKLLLNKNIILNKNNASLAIIGVENWSANKHFITRGNMKEAFSGAETTDVKILLSHDPSHWEAEILPEYPSVNLTLSGHTHAFQMAIELGKFKISPSMLLYKQWDGLYKSPKQAEQYLYVNRGIGTLGYPGRLFNRPEITVFILKRSL